MEDLAFWFLLLIPMIITTIDLVTGIIRTYYARYAKLTYEGSVKYWDSWKERKYDVARQVLEELGIDSPEDLEKLLKKYKRKRRKKRE